MTTPRAGAEGDVDVRAENERALRQAFERAAVTGAVHVMDLATGSEVGVEADDPRCAASVFKLPVLVTLVRLADEGAIDLDEQVTVPLADRTSGPTGISAMSGPVTMSWRDLARLMIVVSDNAATDVILDRIGVHAVDRALVELGCTATRVPHDIRTLFASIVEDAGIRSISELPTALTGGTPGSWRALTPLRTIHTTARDMTRLLARVWDDTAASPASCALVREILHQQVWPHRLASGFPEDEYVTGGKTGTLPPVRNEVGVVSHSDGSRYAVAVLTTARAVSFKHPPADAVIGEAARIAVDALRTVRAEEGTATERVGS